MQTRRPFRLAALAIGLIAASLAALGGQVDAAPAEAPERQERVESPCVSVYRKTASPGVILLGETVDITLTFSVACPREEQPPLHVVLVLDDSDSMQGARSRAMKRAARKFIVSLQIHDHPGTRVGVVEFKTTANILCTLTDRMGAARSCVGAVGTYRPGGGSNISAGVKAGLRVLLRGRQDVADSSAIREVMVVVTDGGDAQGCGNLLGEAESVKREGILLVAVCVGRDCDVECLRAAATSPRHYFEAPDSNQLNRVFEQIYDRAYPTPVREVRVVDKIPPNMKLMAGSVSPPGRTIGPGDDLVEWQPRFIPNDGVTFTLSVRPLEVGYWATNDGASGVFTDSLGRTGRFDYPDPHVFVRNPDAMPTPTPADRPSPTSTATPSPSATSTNAPDPIFVPVAFGDR